ncbi:MAG: 50S ribosomal protein L17 [Bacteroidales bacterium]|nr:50S ribosomal protein L17 [Bacteroidales bacterium]
MRHSRRVNHLGRTSEHRKAMLANMAASLILHKRITTTVAKAKALRGYVEPLITKSKEDSTHSRRVVFSYLQSKEAVTELFREVSNKVANRPGGYTRIIKTGNRLGDNAEMCLIELVDFNENMLKEKAAEKKGASRTTRRGRRGTSAGTAVKAATPAAVVAEPAVAQATAAVREELETNEPVVATDELVTDLDPQTEEEEKKDE